LLDSEPEFVEGIKSLRKDAESRASNLELEVKQLREEIKVIKELLGLNLKEK
jgi:hypothetical protein